MWDDRDEASLGIDWACGQGGHGATGPDHDERVASSELTRDLLRLLLVAAVVVDPEFEARYAAVRVCFLDREAGGIKDRDTDSRARAGDGNSDGDFQRRCRAAGGRRWLH